MGLTSASPYRAVRPVLFALPAETAHDVTLRTGEVLQRTGVDELLARRYTIKDDRLSVEAFGRSFSSPIGVAAGFDKNARVYRLLGHLGFGHVEIGGVTARPQPGNPRPRMFRLGQDRAIVNRMGFNNEGADAIADRLATGPDPVTPVGVNLGASKGVPPEHVPMDYRYTYERVADHGSFFVINVSSPNTPGLRDLQHERHLERIITTLADAGATPLLVKLSPDLSRPGIESIIDLVEAHELDGIVAVNTTTERPDRLGSPNQAQPGGLSGAPLRSRATGLIAFIAERTDVPVVGVGGVFTAEDAYEKIRAGAHLVQLYTGMVYRGPGIARSINAGLLDCLERDGFDSIEAAVGTAP